MPATFIVDDHEQRALFAHYEPAKITRIFTAAAKAGAQAAEAIMVAAAPVGTSSPEGQFYRRKGLGRGAFRASVKARRIRKRGLNRQTIGYVIGPAGPAGFVRAWIEGGTKPHSDKRGRRHPGSKANPWVDRVAPHALGAARKASDAVITRYVSRIPGA